MTTIGPCLDADEAVELGELLEFVGRWLARDDGSLAESLRQFVGGGGYDINELRADVSRFVFLLGGDDEAWLCGGDER
jgi:hypothetical protein